MQPQLLTPTQLAQMLGISPQTVYNRMNLRGDLPRITRIGRLPRFCIDDVYEWVQGKKEAPSLSRRIRRK